MKENKEYLEPDYSGHPSEDDEDEILEEISDEDEAEIERLLDDQINYSERLDRELEEQEEQKMSSSPFGNSGGNNWPGNNNNNSSPWERSQQNNAPKWGGGSSWGSGSGFGQFGGSSWNNNNQPKQEERKSPITSPVDSKKIIICDVLDCLYESWESNGRPNLMPRGIFDIKPKFDVWDRISSFNPTKLYIMFPAPEIIPSFGRINSAKVTLEYVAQSISAYLRIPRERCIILEQMQEGLPKERVLMGAIKDCGTPEDMVYIGVHSGKWGLSSRDITAARICKIDYIDVYNLLDGKYEYE